MYLCVPLTQGKKCCFGQYGEHFAFKAKVNVPGVPQLVAHMAKHSLIAAVNRPNGAQSFPATQKI